MMNAALKVKTRPMDTKMAGERGLGKLSSLDCVSTARIVSRTSPCESGRMSIKKVTRTAEKRPAYGSLVRYDCLQRRSQNSQILEQHPGSSPQVWSHGPPSPSAP